MDRSAPRAADHLSAFHDEGHSAKGCDVTRRITFNSHEIGEEACGNTPSRRKLEDDRGPRMRPAGRDTTIDETPNTR